MEQTDNIQSKSIRTYWHNELARRWLPELPAKIMRGGTIYSLKVEPGYAGYEAEGRPPLVAFRAPFTGLAARNLAGWMFENGRNARKNKS